MKSFYVTTAKLSFVCNYSGSCHLSVPSTGHYKFGGRQKSTHKSSLWTLKESSSRYYPSCKIHKILNGVPLISKVKLGKPVLWALIPKGSASIDSCLIFIPHIRSHSDSFPFEVHILPFRLVSFKQQFLLIFLTEFLKGMCHSPDSILIWFYTQLLHVCKNLDVS